MFKYSLVFFIAFQFNFCAYCQMTPTVTPVIGQYGHVNEKTAYPSTAKGSTYLNEEWKVATLYLFPRTLFVDTLKDVSIKFDIKTNQFDVDTQNKTKVIEGSKVQKFEWFDSKTNQLQTYVNCNAFTFGHTKLIGFCKVSSGRKIQLATYNYIDIIKADYNVALDVGSKEDKLVKKTKLFLINENTMYEADKKTFNKITTDKQIEVRKYIKENNISLNKESDLQLVVDYYNSI